ncbi:histidine kinase, partial [Streptomyces sp. NPDC054841]
AEAPAGRRREAPTGRASASATGSADGPVPLRSTPAPAADAPARPGDAPAWPSGPGPAATSGSTPSGQTLNGLPRRVRQASLAPQLRDTSGGRTSGTPAAAGAEAQDIERDADEVRVRMASLQRGWQRGRRQNAEDATGPGETAPGTTPEGNGR